MQLTRPPWYPTRISTWLSTSSMEPWVPLRYVGTYSMAVATAATASSATMSMVTHVSFGYVAVATSSKNVSFFTVSVPNYWRASTKSCYPVPLLAHRWREDMEGITVKALFKLEISSNGMLQLLTARACPAVWAPTAVLLSLPPTSNLLLPAAKVRTLPRLAFPAGRVQRRLRLRMPQLHRRVLACLSRILPPQDTVTSHRLPSRKVSAEAELPL
mmetsp:Transcript_32742/g.96527  ORF Transcript_32742/g.96527 Transcript_32742/m.96527 type:complete len:215 (+) Transcript_32742:1693-2337(+)